MRTFWGVLLGIGWVSLAWGDASSLWLGKTFSEPGYVWVKADVPSDLSEEKPDWSKSDAQVFGLQKHELKILARLNVPEKMTSKEEFSSLLQSVVQRYQKPDRAVRPGLIYSIQDWLIEPESLPGIVRTNDPADLAAFIYTTYQTFRLATPTGRLVISLGFLDTAPGDPSVLDHGSDLRRMFVLLGKLFKAQPPHELAMGYELFVTPEDSRKAWTLTRQLKGYLVASPWEKVSIWNLGTTIAEPDPSRHASTLYRSTHLVLAAGAERTYLWNAVEPARLDQPDFCFETAFKRTAPRPVYETFEMMAANLEWAQFDRGQTINGSGATVLGYTQGKRSIFAVWSETTKGPAAAKPRVPVKVKQGKAQIVRMEPDGSWSTRVQEFDQGSLAADPGPFFASVTLPEADCHCKESQGDPRLQPLASGPGPVVGTAPVQGPGPQPGLGNQGPIR